MKVFDLVELFECVVVILGIIDVWSYGQVFLVFLGDIVFEFLLDFDVYQSLFETIGLSLDKSWQIVWYLLIGVETQHIFWIAKTRF